MPHKTKPCTCGHVADFSRYCAAYVCGHCGNHVGLARCYCGWAASGGNGRQELIEMGETIGDDGEDQFFSEDAYY